MSETEIVGNGKSTQKITTHYKKTSPSTATEKSAVKHSDRRQENREKRDAQLKASGKIEHKYTEGEREAFHEREDSTLYKKGQKRNKPNAKEEEYEEEEPPQPRKRAAQPRPEPSRGQRMGDAMAMYMGKQGGAPAWIGKGSTLPPAMRMGSGSPPPALQIGAGKPPAWLFGGIPGTPPKGKQQQGNGLPPWFRY